MARSIAGPFRCHQSVGVDALISAKKSWLYSYTVANGSGAAVTVNFYDPAGGSLADVSTPVETIVVPAGQSYFVQPNLDTQNGLSVKASLWTSLTVSSRWCPY